MLPFGIILPAIKVTTTILGGLVFILILCGTHQNVPTVISALTGNSNVNLISSGSSAADHVTHGNINLVSAEDQAKAEELIKKLIPQNAGQQLSSASQDGAQQAAASGLETESIHYATAGCTFLIVTSSVFFLQSLIVIISHLAAIYACGQESDYLATVEIPLDVVSNLIAFLFYLIASSMTVHTAQNTYSDTKDTMMAAGALGIILSIVHAGHAIVAYLSCKAPAVPVVP